VKTDEPEINQGVEIILNRMDSNPDEFGMRGTHHSARWGWFLDWYKETDVLTAEEKDLITAKIHNIQRNALTKRVLEEIMKEPEKEPSEEDRISELLRQQRAMAQNQQAAIQKIERTDIQAQGLTGIQAQGLTGIGAALVGGASQGKLNETLKDWSEHDT
jgi:hypothetical protein